MSDVITLYPIVLATAPEAVMVSRTWSVVIAIIN